MADVIRLSTTEEYARLPETSRPTELVRGRVVELNFSTPRHGQICAQIALLVGRYFEVYDLGHLLINGCGVVTERDPDTVRGADLAFYSYARIPKGPLPDGYLSQPPELVFEVRSSEDRWTKLLAKAAEYLEAGVSVVCILDPKSQQAHLFYADRPTEVLTAGDELSFPEILGAFRVRVGRFFE